MSSEEQDRWCFNFTLIGLSATVIALSIKLLEFLCAAIPVVSVSDPTGIIPTVCIWLDSSAKLVSMFLYALLILGIAAVHKAAPCKWTERHLLYPWMAIVAVIGALGSYFWLGLLGLALTPEARFGWFPHSVQEAGFLTVVMLSLMPQKMRELAKF